jgi:chaperonin GroES
MKELQPLNENVLLELATDKGEQKTASGIIIPSSAVEEKNIAKVLAVGVIEKSAISVGDSVLYKKHHGEKVEFEGKKYLLIPYADLLAKIVETEEI